MHLFTCVFVLSEFGLKIQCFKQKMKNDMKTDKAPLLFISNDPRVTLQTIQRKKAHRDDGLQTKRIIRVRRTCGSRGNTEPNTPPNLKKSYC